MALELMSRRRSAAPVDSGGVPGADPDAHRSRVRLTRLAVAAVVLIASAVLGWLVLQSQQATTEVWVAAQRLDAGVVIAESDVLLRQVDQGSTLDAVPAQELVVGRTVRVTVPAGSAFVEGHFFASADALAAPGTARVSLIFPLGHVTLAVERNDVVRIVVVGSGGDGETAVFDNVPVIDVQQGERTGHVLTVAVPVDVSDQLVEAIADGEAYASVVGRR